MGLEYRSSKTRKIIPAKTFKMFVCPNSCKQQCKHIPEYVRKEIFDEYWKLDKLGKQRMLLTSSKIRKKKRASNVGAPSRRNNTIDYTLNGLQVCQKVFLSSFGVTNNTINRLLKQQNTVGSGNYDRISSKRKDSVFTADVQEVIIEVIESLPKYNIHYTDTSKEADNVVYLAPTTTLQVIFDLVDEKLTAKSITTKPKYGTFCSYFKKVYPHIKIKPMSTDKLSLK